MTGSWLEGSEPVTPVNAWPEPLDFAPKTRTTQGRFSYQETE